MKNWQFWEYFKIWIVTTIFRLTFPPNCRHDRFCSYAQLQNCISGLCNYHCVHYCGCGTGGGKYDHSENNEDTPEETWADIII